MKTLFTLMLLLAAATAGAKSGSESLMDAHHAYLKGNWKAMTRHLTMVLQQRDQVESRNAMKLLEKAYAQTGGMLEADFKLPKEIEKMRIIVRRRNNGDDTVFRIGVRGSTELKNIISQIRVTRYPDQVVLDKIGGKGEWSEEYIAVDKQYYFNLSGEKQKDPVASGLYFVHLELTNGVSTDGYVILSDLNATASPEIVSPYSGETFATVTPTFKWKNFISPQFKPFEKRFASIDVYENSEVNNYKDRWNYWLADPAAESASIGMVSPDVLGDSKLEDGPFSVSVNFQERRKFGDVWLSRESQATRNFHIKTK
ncbi:MAG: DUF2861 family protein [Bdellovibrionia bacterium]